MLWFATTRQILGVIQILGSDPLVCLFAASLPPKQVEPAVRVIQDTDQAVAFALAGARILEKILVRVLLRAKRFSC